MDNHIYMKLSDIEWKTLILLHAHRS
jgi:hypothetical protein